MSDRMSSGFSHGGAAGLPASRREFLARNAMGIGGVALAWLLRQDKLLATPANIPRTPQSFDMKPKEPHHPPRAQAMISLFMHGGPSHVDLLDPKPELTKHSGSDYQGEVTYSFINRASKKLFGSPWKFRKCGQAGTDVSELLPHFSRIVDDVCVIRSMHTDINGHESSIWFMNTGKSQPGRPPLFQGTVVRSREPRILNLDPPAHLKGALQRSNLEFLADLNRRHLAEHPGEADLEARIASYELAARMQSAAKDALDLSQETKATQEMYGLDNPETAEYGARCLVARRLVERGVRFVQLFIAGQIWDNHTNIRGALPSCCRKTDKPAAALVTDLKQRGLLESTIVHWGGE